MTRSFAGRIVLNFAALFLLALGLLFWLWYFGLPSAGIVGEQESRLAQGIRVQEARVRQWQALMNDSISELRGDVLVMAENGTLVQQVAAGDPQLQASVQRLFVRWQRAYPDRFHRVSVVDPLTARVLASSETAQRGQVWDQSDLLQRARQAGVSELVLPMPGRPEHLAIVRQIRSVDDDGYVSDQGLGILVVQMHMQQFLGSGDEAQAAGSGVKPQAFLFDQSGQGLAYAGHASRWPDLGPTLLAPFLRSGFEGTMLQTSRQGEDLVLTLMPVDPAVLPGWTIVHVSAKSELLAGLQDKAESLAWVALLISALTLPLIWWMANRLTRPLKSLAGVAQQLGGGERDARADLQGTHSREVQGLALAFNGMADAVQQAQQGLEAQVQARTAELQHSEARHRTLFETNPDAVLVLDHFMVVVDCNPAARLLFGAPRREDLVGRQLSDLSPSVQLDDKDSCTAATRCIELAVQRGQHAFEWLHQRLDDEVTFIAEVLLSRVDLEGQVLIQAVVRDISTRRQAEEQIRQLAFYDPLTELPNRRLLMDRLAVAQATALRHRSLGALLFVDLDNFKTLNDTLGHERGDQLLVQVARRLSTCVRESDSVARLGGDEFVVMLLELSADVGEAAKHAEQVGRKILAVLGDSYQLDHDEFHSTPSIGMTLFGLVHEGLDEPLKRADLAMYQAKAAGKNTLCAFDPQMQALVNARAAMEAGLRLALTQRQFLLHYQAQVAHGEPGQPGRIIGAEVLLRWHHPQMGMVSPAEFIALAEDTGLIVPLGAWVLETACQQLARWADQPELAGLSLAVNVSAKQFHQEGFVDMVLSLLSRSGARPQALKLELTEGVLVVNADLVTAKMQALKDAGVGFSLDDFGTGYSSLAYLKRLPLDQLKIDQGFVRDILVDPNDAAIARMVVVLAESLGLTVIAEGVETQAQCDFLRSQGCMAYQGYLFSRPVPLDAFEALVLEHAPNALKVRA
ncbi:putative bifunctional diguanylate cyclase/phosphodiesterase [Roseateles sp.]|uniref:putative bifunctional diguanylate cyclase/phosphodiesterase n=1 Tax=Roseateles sp. TaxID=1971397 RepID=UPI003BA3E9F7